MTYSDKSWISEKLILKSSQIEGIGVFTNSSIKKGEKVIVWGGVLININDFKQGKGEKHTNVGISDTEFLVAKSKGDISIDDFMNHSCNPNLGLIDEVTLVAIRDIEANEELTIDYAIELADLDYVMTKKCNCKSPNCRKTITGKDWQLKSVQSTCGKYFSPFLKRKL